MNKHTHAPLLSIPFGKRISASWAPPSHVGRCRLRVRWSPGTPTTRSSWECSDTRPAPWTWRRTGGRASLAARARDRRADSREWPVCWEDRSTICQQTITWEIQMDERWSWRLNLYRIMVAMCSGCSSATYFVRSDTSSVSIESWREEQEMKLKFEWSTYGT